MSGNNYLWSHAAKMPDQLPLKVRVHIHIRFVKYHSMVSVCSAKEPNSLQPHLETMAHCGYFGNEIPVAHEQV
jgi:hypothetical protein